MTSPPTVPPAPPPTAPPTAESFPRQSARTQRFTLGVPRSFTIAPDGSRVAFLRAPSGSDRRTRLCVLDLPPAQERVAADPVELLSGGDEQLSQAERARRERLREGAAGVVSYATDRAVTLAAFALSGGLYVADLAHGGARRLQTATPVVDPRPDPHGRRVAYVADGALRVVPVDGDSPDQTLAAPDGPDVTWGLAEFVAAEEMDRSARLLVVPDGDRLLVARVDESPVQRWHVADPAEPATPPVELAYPAAGTPNADVTLWLVDLDGPRIEVAWDRAAFPYLVEVAWGPHGPPLVLVQSRDQRRTQVLTVDPTTGAAAVVREETDDAWLDIVSGVPAWTQSGALLTTADRDGARRLLLDGEPATPPDLQVRGVAGVDGDTVLFTASAGDPTEIHLWRLADGQATAVTYSPGVHGGRAGGGLTVVVSASLDYPGVQVGVLRGEAEVARIPSYAETPVLEPRPTLFRAGRRALHTAVLLPTGHAPGSARLPVLLDPYGGPHAQRVLRARSAFLTSQWFAEQGFAVVIADGRGTPGRGPAWEREVAFDLATPVLEDQVDALHGAAERFPDDLDLTRVAIRGWSFGGFLAALAVLRRPDVFAAAVAGAPVTDQRLYDTHYTERYLGDPAEHPEAYAVSSLLDDASRLERPLMLIHGLADDNVVAAHTLRLSSALLAAGRAHTVLPLSGVTHMTPQETVAENLLLLQVRFLRESLGLG